MRATDVNRTLQSAESHLYGLYPPGSGPSIPDNLSDIYTIPPYTDVQPDSSFGPSALPFGYQPIPVNTVD